MKPFRLYILLLGALLFPLRQFGATVSICTEAGLRTALQAGGLVQLQCGSGFTNFTLTAPIVISKNTTLTSTNEVVITGNNSTRLVVVSPGVNFRLENITLFSGRQSATNLNSGGITDIAGAAIYNNGGNVTVFKGRFQNHTLFGVTGLDGLNGNVGDDGENGGDAAGAAIFNNGGNVTISNSVFEANSVTGGPGGNGGNGGGGLGGDGGRGGNGGSAGGAAIFSQGGQVSLFNSIFTNNVVKSAVAGAGGSGTGLLGFNGLAGSPGDATGGAVGGRNATLIIYGCTFVSNQAISADGGNGSAGLRNLEGDPGIAGGAAAGGAIYGTGSLSVTNSTFFANSATSGKGGNGGAGGSGSFGENGGNGGNGGTASGGAIENSGLTQIIHVTFSDNVLTGGAGGMGGTGGGVLGEKGDDGSPGSALGGAVNAPIASAKLANTILANSSVALLNGSIIDLGGNLATETNRYLSIRESYLNANPALQALASNGGPTPTMAIDTNSAAIDKGATAFCLTLDQRGSNRVARCDIGAFEFLPAVTNIILPPIPTNVLHLSASLALTNNSVSLLWPSGYTNVYLQFTTNLSSTNWTTAGNKFQTNGTNNLFLTSATNSPRVFFRLQGLTNISLTDTNLFPPPPGGTFPPLPDDGGGPPTP